jgi:hypothetical protein
MKRTRVGWILFVFAAGILFFTAAAGMFTPFTASPSPSTIVTLGVVVGVPLAVLGVSMVFPCLGVTTRMVAKRLAMAFALVLGIYAISVFGGRLLRQAISEEVGGLFYLGSVWLVPAIIYLAALSRAPILYELQTSRLRVVRVGILTCIAFGLSFASMFAVLGIWVAAGIMFGFPVRHA